MTNPIENFNSVQEGQKQEWDKNNARNYLDGKIGFSNENGTTIFSYAGKELQFPKLSSKDGKLINDLVQTLITERSVCEARMYLARECKAEVETRGIISSAGGPDITFNPSPFRLSTAIFPYEGLPKIKELPPRAIANQISEFVNNLPMESLVPLQIIEKSNTSYSQSKHTVPPKK